MITLQWPDDNVDVDSVDTSFHWELFKEELDHQLSSLNTKGYWKVTGRNVGWRKKSGTAYIEGSDANSVLRLWSGYGDYHLTIKIYANRLECTVSHHDAPTGEHWTLTPCVRSTYEKHQ